MRDVLNLTYQLIELLAGANIEAPEALEEFAQVLDRRVAKDFGFPVLSAAESLRQMRDQLRQLFKECFLRQTNGLIKPSSNPRRFLLVELRTELAQIVWGSTLGKS